MNLFHTFETLALHSRKLSLMALLLIASIMINVMDGDVKQWEAIDWVDVIGEGGSAIAVGLWMLLILGSRPTGRVSNLLATGLAIIFFSLWQDSLDEFIKMPASPLLGSWFESTAMPIGIFFLTFGLFHWHQEQLIISRQLKKRERFVREHTSIDGITQLARADYLKAILDRTIKEHTENSQTLSLLIVDIKDFDSFNMEHGMREANHLLESFATLLTLTIRNSDLLCRYAGDRYAIVMPNTDIQTAQLLANDILSSAENFYYKHSDTGLTLRQSVNIGIAQHQGNLQSKCHNAKSLLLAANQSLANNKPYSSLLRSA